VVFYCIKCTSPLANTGLVNQFVCEGCKCIYEVKVELREITNTGNNENIRKLPAARDSKIDSK
jgi:hypothetical protein